MNRLTCEMCNSTDVVKQDSFFVCQSCGTKYSVEEAKKMMIEGTVDVSGSTVKVDDSEELKKMYQAARNARKNGDDETAIKHYENISAKDPNSWEAMFYLVILKTNSITNGEIESSAIKIMNIVDNIIQLIKENIVDDAEQKEAVEEVVSQCYDTALSLSYGSFSFYKSSTQGNGLIALTGITGLATSIVSSKKSLSEHQMRCLFIASIMGECAESIKKHFGLNDKKYKELIVFSWKKQLYLNDDFKKNHKLNLFNDQTLDEISNNIKQFSPDEHPTENNDISNIDDSTAGNSSDNSSGYNNSTNSSGCYVATCVYGSYDCPEVWTLRRYRDYKLDTTWYGRIFIKTYYAISPTIVKWFGNTNWFKKLWKSKLDRMVSKLQDQGYENTRYNDKY